MRKNDVILRNGPVPLEMPIGAEQMKPYSFHEVDDNSVEVEMYGQVVENRPMDWWTGKPMEGLYIVLAEFVKVLDTYKDKENITFRINSVGGDLYAGIAIGNRISELKGNTITIVDGLAASAATFILQGGKKRRAYAGSQVMIHGASVFIYGSYNEKDIQQIERRIEAGNKSAIEVYAERTGKEKGYIKSLMDKEEWMTGQEALENGFIDEVIKTENKVTISLSENGKIVMSNGIPMPAEGFKNLPQNICFMQIAHGSRPVVIEEQENEAGGKETMNMEELKQKHPELVQQIEAETKLILENNIDAAAIKNEAGENERKRIKEIEEIENQIADKELVNKAKYDKPITAQELAFQAMRQQKGEEKKFIDSMKCDSDQSGVNDVLPVPNGGEKSREEQHLEDVNNGAALIAGIK